MILNCTVVSCVPFTSKDGRQFHRLELVPDNPVNLGSISSKPVATGTRCLVSYKNGKVEDISICE